MAIKSRQELIKGYLDFFKKRGHKEIQNAPLIPQNDPTVLFTTAGMHPLVPYLLGEKHPLGKRLVNNQACIRTGDIEEVGDESHLTFFEMLGNWSLGDYWKKEAIELSYEFLTEILKISKEKINATCFKGDKDAPKDRESAEAWKSLGVKRIRFLPKTENWWGPAGTTGPCGPDTEMFVAGFEIWNDVFMQYNKTASGKYKPLKQKNVDTGMGVERTLAILNNLKSVYETETFLPIIRQIEKLSKKEYGKDSGETRVMRIIADHIKAAAFILAEGIAPSNTEQGYVLRRLIRRAIRHGKAIMMQNNFTKQIAEIVISMYPDYTNLKKNRSFILEQIEKEEDRFRQTVASGLKFFNRITEDAKSKAISGKNAFLLYQSYGFPIELTEELAKERGMKIDVKGYEKEAKKHQKLSRTAAAGRFKSGLADRGKETTKLHTATHLLLAALRKILGEGIIQKGSNITPERLRLDFNFPRKLTEGELKKIGNLVNQKIKEKIKVIKKEVSPEQAKKGGAMGAFGAKYGNRVSVYIIGEFSKEICAGPHASDTGYLGKFKIIKEESSSAGVRRIKAVLE